MSEGSARGGREIAVGIGLAVLAALGWVLPEPRPDGWTDAHSAAIAPWNVGVSIVAGLVFLLLLQRVVTGRGWGPATERPVETPFSIEPIALLAGFFVLHALGATAASALDSTGLLGRFVGQILANVLLVVFAVVVWRAARWSPERARLAPFRRATVGIDLLVGASLALAVLPVLNGETRVGSVALEAIGQTPTFQAIVTSIRDEPDPGVLVLAAVFTVIFAPLAEEILFRGYLYTALRRVGGPLPAAVGSAVVFAAIHGSAFAALPLFALGFALAWIYERNGSLVAPVAMHAVFNGIQFVGILLLPGGAT